MNDEARTDIGTPAPTPAELHDQVERTRDELGRTVEALAAKADIKARAKAKAAAVKDQAAQVVKDKTPDPLLEKTVQAAVHVRESAAKAGQYATDKTPDPLLERAGQAATAVRTNRTPLLVAVAAVAVFLLVRRSRGRRR